MNENHHLQGLINELFNLKPFLPGVVNERHKKCGRPGCHCADEKNPRKHVCYQLCYNLGKKGSTLHVKKPDLEKVRDMTDSYKRLRNLTTGIALEAIRLVREYGPGEAAEIMETIFEKAKDRASGGKPESGKLRDAKASQAGWRKKALEYKTDLDKNRTTIRDLTESRKKWRDEALRSRKIIKEHGNRLKNYPARSDDGKDRVKKNWDFEA